MIVAPQNQPLNVFMCVLSSEWNKLWVMRVTGDSGYELSVVKCASECCKAHNREREKKACRGDSMWFLVCEVSQELTSLAHSALIDHCTKPQLNLWYNLHPNTRRRRKTTLKINLWLYHGTWQDDHLRERKGRKMRRASANSCFCYFVTQDRCLRQECVHVCTFVVKVRRFRKRNWFFGSLIISADTVILTTTSSFL